MDKLFGNNMIDEIIWKRSSAHGDTKQGAKHLGRVHDTILVYGNGDEKERTWNMFYSSYDESYVEHFYHHIEDGTGRHYQLDNLTAAKPGGDTSYEWKGVRPPVGRYWAYSREKMEEFERQGRIYYPKKVGGMPRYKRYLDEMPGMPLQDVWDDIKVISSQSKERLGYPTQKPEVLLERIIKISSNPTDIVLDPMCGCGTAIAVAQKLGRRWVGIDISPTACNLMANRMRGIGAQNLELIGLPKSIEEVKALQPFEFQNWVMQKLMGRVSPRKTGDMGIDGYLFDGTPIQVKQSEDVGRNVIDNFETAIKRGKKAKGIIVAFSFGKGAYEEVARAKNQDGVEIELKQVEEIIKEN
jgi:adenine-specific DNA-methyltransferase